MIKLSAIILTKNVEKLIADCIDSVSFCDEIIVIDDGSTDRTTEIAKLMKADVYALVARSFSERRNYGLKKAKGKWVFYIDADERVSPQLRSAIEEIVDKEKTYAAAYQVQRKNFYLGKNEWPTVEKLER
jgi:(heptosyl)LPS beta-1,4-glucosyltransferase